MTVRKQVPYIIGIDEVGRGPLAGPVVVCAVAIPRTFRAASIKQCVPLRDSKKLSALQRGAWAATIKTNPHIRHAISAISPRTVDRINVTQAANRAATRALTKLIAALPAPTRIDVFLDGGLFILPGTQFAIRNLKSNTKKKYTAIFHNKETNQPIPLRVATVIKGDEHIPTISLASIAAKEHRDAFMRRAHKKYPQYGFNRHVGYGTKRHIAAIKKNGHSPLHRKSFLKKIL